MNYKKLLIIFLAFLAVVLSIGTIYASDDIAELKSADNSDTVFLNSESILKTQNIVNSDVKKSQNTTASKEKIKTKVEADPTAAVYKKNNYFKIKVEDKYDDDIAVKNVKLKVKVKSGSKVKTFEVKTNSHGIAKINTKSLKVGTYKVTITSADDSYEIKKTSKIFIGKQYKATIKKGKKTLKNKDVLKLKTKNDFDEKDVKVVLSKSKFTKILKAKFYFKNKKTGKLVVKTDKCDFDDGRWEMPDADYPNSYRLVKVDVYYISTK